MIKHLHNLFSSRNALVIVAIAFFFCMNQYNGILVDAILYTLQATHFVHPERFADDVSFMYGNQDSFTIFSPLYAACINLFGISNAAFLLCFLSQFLFAGAFSYLVYSWFEKFHCKKIAFPTLILFFALYRYGELRSVIYQFNLVEPYVVPRTFSVAFALFGLGNFFHSKIKSLTFILLGTTFNPLMAGWALPLWIFFYYPKTLFPIVVGCTLFPLSALLGVGPLDYFDSEWLSPASKDFHLIHFVPFGLFFLWGTIAFQKNASLGRIFKVLLFVWGIAFYWYTMAKVTQHVFLNQAQIFRMEWFCVTTTFPLMINALYRLWILKFRKKEKGTAQDYLLLLFPVLFWIDSVLVDCCLIYAILYAKDFQNKHRKWVCLSLRIAISTILAATLIIELMRTTGNSPLDDYQIKEYIRTFSLINIFLIIFLYLKKEYSKEKTFFLLFISCLSILCFKPIPFEEQSIAEVIALATLTVFCAHPIRRTRRSFIFISLLWLIPYTMIHYDKRDQAQISSEKNMTLFWRKTIFPEILERGKILFVTEGFHYIHPRLQFLTGAYIDNQSLAGGLLFKMQHVEAQHRLSMLFFGQKKLPSRYDHHDFQRYWEFLYDKNRLKDKYSFLCTEDEIHYLITDIELDGEIATDYYYFPKENKKINLYKCLK